MKILNYNKYLESNNTQSIGLTRKNQLDEYLINIEDMLDIEQLNINIINNDRIDIFLIITKKINMNDLESITNYYNFKASIFKEMNLVFKKCKDLESFNIKDKTNRIIFTLF